MVAAGAARILLAGCGQEASDRAAIPAINADDVAELQWLTQEASIDGFIIDGVVHQHTQRWSSALAGRALRMPYVQQALVATLATGFFLAIYSHSSSTRTLERKDTISDREYKDFESLASINAAAPSCFESGTSYQPLDMIGSTASLAASAVNCQSKCAISSGCAHFSFDNVTMFCHIQGVSATAFKLQPTFIAGPPACSTSVGAASLNQVMPRGIESEVNAALGHQSLEKRIPLPGGQWVCLSTRGASALVLRLGCDTRTESTMISPEEPDAPWQNATSSKYGRGIRSGVGSLFITDHGSVNLLDADGNLVTQSSPIKNQSDISFLASGGRVYGRGAGADDARHLSYYGNVTPVVMNWFGKGSQTHVPYYYTTDGYGALGVSAGTWTKPSGSFLSSTYDASPVEIRWHDVDQGSLELYLMPAASLQLGTTAYYNLVGRPRVPPLWTFGFIASRWGWEDHEYIDDTLLRFRSGEYPADAFVIDFEWYTKEPDYTYTKDGNSSCDDFGFNDLLFPNPRQQLTDYREKLHFRFGGIRKSRFCNSETLSMARKKGWILPQGALGGEKYYAEGREFNWTNPDVRSWYREHMTPLIADGISFWWNDEMESQYFNYFWINIAQAQSFHEVHPTKRFWSINRNFAPGMARLGVGFWTGDSSPTWPELGLQPGYVLNWALAGAPYVASDIGGFTGNTTADLLVRWYQVGVFMPIMRVHCTGGQWATPRWPWLWGTDAEKALTKAMQLRYRLISYHYSLAMAMYLDGSLWMKPMVMSPSVEISQNLSDTTSQWFDGELLVAPVLRKDSVKEIYLPQGIWYPFEGFEQGAWNNGPAIEGPHFVGGHARYDEIPVYAPSGCIVPLAPVVQYTEALPGGPLEVRIYPGKDATFPLYEDDGETLYYEYGHVKTTRFSWNDKLRKLSWSVSGEASGSTQFKRMFATVIEPQGGSSTSEVVDLGSGGSISLQNSENAVLLSAELQTTTELPS